MEEKGSKSTKRKATRWEQTAIEQPNLAVLQEGFTSLEAADAAISSTRETCAEARCLAFVILRQQAAPATEPMTPQAAPATEPMTPQAAPATEPMTLQAAPATEPMTPRTLARSLSWAHMAAAAACVVGGMFMYKRMK